ncbi:MAG: toxin, partial [Polyangiaceae bacterium]|nr:toxin [Polyangiaceae bacterium]
MMHRPPPDDPKKQPGTGPQSPSAQPAHRGLAPIAPPSPSLPTGGGAIRGIGEKLSVSAATGTGSLQVPISTTPGRSGFHPELSLTYDSGAGNGPFGAGWSLSVPQITRKTDKGLPRYDDAKESDTFILSGAEDLVPALREGGELDRFEDEGETVQRYRPRIEGLFARIERRQASGGAPYWKVTTRDNVTSIYGRSEEARVFDPSAPRRIFSWLLEETRDDRGHVITYHYKSEDLAGVPRDAIHEAHRHAGAAPITNCYLKRIRYGNATPGDPSTALFEVVFDYGEHDPLAPTSEDTASPWPCRRDPFSAYRAGFEIRSYRLCRRVLMFHWMPELGPPPCLVRSTDFTYTDSPVLTQLVAVTHSGYIRDPATLTYQQKSLPPLELGYSQPEIRRDARTLDERSTRDLAGTLASGAQWVDLDSEGLPGLLVQQHQGALLYKRNLGGGVLSPARPLATRPSMTQANLQVMDIDGDGQKEMVFFQRPMSGYFDRTEDGSWGP